jgi:hypothetical protein
VLASEGISELAFLTFAGGSVNQPAIVVRGGNASVSLSYCRVSEGGGTGVLVEGGGKATFQECRVYGNKGAGVLVRSSGEVTLRSTQVHANRDGLEVRGAKAQAEGGTTFKSSQDAGVVAVDKAAVVLAGCKFESNAKADIRASNNSTVKASPMPTGKREADGTSKIE